MIAKQIELIAKAAGHIIVGTATCEADATAMADLLSPDIAFVDINLGKEASGLDVASFISRYLGRLVVFTTSNPKLIPEDCCGAAGCIDKPFTQTGFNLAIDFLADKVFQRQESNRKPDSLRLSPRYQMIWR